MTTEVGELLFDALSAHGSKYLGLYAVYRRLELDLTRASDGRVNGQVAKSIGMHKDHVRRCFKVLSKLGVVHLPHVMGTSFNTILLVTRLNDELRERLAGVKAGDIQIDVTSTSVTETDRVFMETDPRLYGDGVDLKKGVFPVEKDGPYSIIYSIIDSTVSHDSTSASTGPNTNQSTVPNTLQSARIEKLVDRIQELEDQIKRSKAAKKDLVASEAELVEIDWAYECWKRLIPVYKEAKLTKRRRDILLARIRGGTSRHQFEQAFLHVASNPFFAGQNERKTRYDDLLNICRNQERLERYATQGAGGKSWGEATKNTNLLPRRNGENRGKRW